MSIWLLSSDKKSIVGSDIQNVFCEIYFVKNIAKRVDSETFIFDVILYGFPCVNASKTGLLKIVAIKVTELIKFRDWDSGFFFHLNSL